MMISWSNQLTSLSKKSNSIWILMEDTVIPHSSTQSTDWEVSQKDFPECVPSMEVPSCWTLISMKSFSKMERLQVSERDKRSPSAPRLFVTQPMPSSATSRRDWLVSEKLSDVSVSLIISSQKLKRFPLSRLSSHKDKLEENQISSSWWSALFTRSANKDITLPSFPPTRNPTTQKRKFNPLLIWSEKSEKSSLTSLNNISLIQNITRVMMDYISAILWTQLLTSNLKPRMSWISIEKLLERKSIWLTSQKIKTNENNQNKKNFKSEKYLNSIPLINIPLKKMFLIERFLNLKIK